MPCYFSLVIKLICFTPHLLSSFLQHWVPWSEITKPNDYVRICLKGLNFKKKKINNDEISFSSNATIIQKLESILFLRNGRVRIQCLSWLILTLTNSMRIPTLQDPKLVLRIEEYLAGAWSYFMFTL